MSRDSLKTYLQKRDFRKTAEPAGDSAHTGTRPVFVIQRHDASTDHYDFRLEINGVLASWAVPKGPSTDPSVKRLAIRTEDHPRDYADFEGVIPEAEYGGGTVLVWDAGSYRSLKEDDDDNTMARCLSNGHLTIWLNGEKLRGGYALTRIAKHNDDKDEAASDDGSEQWLLVKMDDDEADARRNPVSTETKSVTSGRSLKEINADEQD